MKQALAITAISFAYWLANIPIATANEVCAGGPQHQWLKPESVREKVRELGYAEFVLAFEDGCYEAKVEQSDGKRLEIYMDPVTGEVVLIKGDEKS